ncbi:MAG: IS630 family transposase [Chloroflexota bacterium]
METETRKQAIKRLQNSYQQGQTRLIKRIHALLAVAEGQTIAEVAEILALSEESVRNYIRAFLKHGVESLHYRRPPGRPAKLTKKQRKKLAEIIEAGPEEAGYDCGCWNTVLVQDLIEKEFKVSYNLHYIAELLKNMGFSYQKARFVSDHLDNVSEAQATWMTQTWPEIKRLAETKGGMILFGDEASFAQWGTLSYTWARRGEQPTVKTSGRRKAYKVFGLIDYLSGHFFYKGITDKFNSASYQTFLLEVLEQTTKHLILIQDGARYHTSKAMQEFFQQHADRLSVYQLPAYSPDFNPIEYLWRNVKKQATHLRYFKSFTELSDKVEEKLKQFADLPQSILALMGKYCESLGAEAVTVN